MIDHYSISNIESLPYEDNFDLVFSDNVMEHIENPDQIFSEVHRVLKPGGIFIFKTPNKFHYMPIIAMITPHSFLRWINAKRGRDETDTFPTRYNVIRLKILIMYKK